jgi:hypothetical protein
MCDVMVTLDIFKSEFRRSVHLLVSWDDGHSKYSVIVDAAGAFMELLAGWRRWTSCSVLVVEFHSNVLVDWLFVFSAVIRDLDFDDRGTCDEDWEERLKIVRNRIYPLRTAL